MMLTEYFKDTITDLAYSAVSYVEDVLSSSSGKTKKRAAIEFVVNKLPVPTLFKGLIGVILNKFIDDSIERAVEFMNQVTNEG